MNITIQCPKVRPDSYAQRVKICDSQWAPGSIYLDACGLHITAESARAIAAALIGMADNVEKKRKKK